MATRSNLALRENNNITQVYVHWDGYPEGLGDTIYTLLKCKWDELENPITRVTNWWEFLDHAEKEPNSLWHYIYEALVFKAGLDAEEAVVTAKDVPLRDVRRYIMRYFLEHSRQGWSSVCGLPPECFLKRDWWQEYVSNDNQELAGKVIEGSLDEVVYRIGRVPTNRAQELRLEGPQSYAARGEPLEHDSVRSYPVFEMQSDHRYEEFLYVLDLDGDQDILWCVEPNWDKINFYSYARLDLDAEVPLYPSAAYGAVEDIQRLPGIGDGVTFTDPAWKSYHIKARPRRVLPGKENLTVEWLVADPTTLQEVETDLGTYEIMFLFGHRLRRNADYLVYRAPGEAVWARFNQLHAISHAYGFDIPEIDALKDLTPALAVAAGFGDGYAPSVELPDGLPEEELVDEEEELTDEPS